MKPHIILIDKIIYFLQKIKEGLINCVKPNQKNLTKEYDFKKSLIKQLDDDLNKTFTKSL